VELSAKGDTGGGPVFTIIDGWEAMFCGVLMPAEEAAIESQAWELYLEFAEGLDFPIDVKRRVFDKGRAEGGDDFWGPIVHIYMNKHPRVNAIVFRALEQEPQGHTPLYRVPDTGEPLKQVFDEELVSQNSPFEETVRGWQEQWPVPMGGECRDGTVHYWFRNLLMRGTRIEHAQDATLLAEAALRQRELDQEAAEYATAQKRETELEEARQVLSGTAIPRQGGRGPVPADVQKFVWQRDGGHCVRCGSQKNLEYDHIIPVAKGGANTARNVQLLCQDCNRKKGVTIGYAER